MMRNLRRSALAVTVLLLLVVLANCGSGQSAGRTAVREGVKHLPEIGTGGGYGACAGEVVICKD